MAAKTLEDRLTIVEQELERLKQRLDADNTSSSAAGWEQIFGIFKDCPEFEEAVRLGQEWRESQQMEYDDDTDEENDSNVC